MADLYYYEEGYIDISYHVYVADAEIALGPYIEENYIDANYYDDYSSVASLTCELTLRPGETVSATGAWTSAFTQTAAVGRLQSVSADFTSAFSPTLTVDAFKNSFAVLDVTVALSSTAVATRSVNVLLEHIADLNAMAAKTVDILSPITATATLSSAPVKSLVSSATLTSTATLSCVAFNVTFFDAQLSFGSAVTTSRYFGTGRPRTGTVDASAYFDATTKFEGTHSIARSGLGSIYTSDQYDQFRPKVNEAFSFSTYVWVDEGPGPAGTVRILAGIGQFTNQNPNNRSATEDMWYVAMGSRQLAFAWNIGGSWYSASGISGIDLNGTAGWVNINFGRQANATAVNYNASGSPVAGGSAFRGLNLAGQNGALVQPSTAANRKLKLFGVDNAYYIGADPITRFDNLTYSVNDQTQIVLKFNNNSTDTLEVITHEGAAALTSTASITAIGTNVKGAASAALTSTVTVSANAGKLQTAAAALNAAVTQSTDAVKTVRTILALSSSVAVSATAYRIKEFVSNQNALFTPNIICQAQLAGVALLETQFTQSTSAVKTARTTTTITAVATLSSSMTVTAGLAADLTSVSTVTATATRIQTFASALASASTLACEFTAFNNVTAALSTAVTLTANIDHLVGYASSMTSAVTMTSDLRRVRLTSSTQSAVATVSVTATRIQSADSALSSVATQSTVAVKTPGINISITASATVAVSAVKTASAIITAGALFTPSMDADAQFAGFALLESTSTVTAIIGSIKQFEPRVNTGLQLPISGMPNTGPFNATIYPNDIQEQGYPLGSIAFPQGYAYNAATISIWVKRNTNSSGGTLIQSREYSVPRDLGFVAIDGNTIRLADYGYSGLITVDWTSALPSDTDWHHLFFRYRDNLGGFYGDGYELFVDGVSKGSRELQSVEAGIIPFVAEYGCIVGGGNFAVAQLRVGDDTITVSDIYDYDRGYRDLGANGRGYFNELNAPGIYATFNEPWSNIVVGEGSDVYVQYYQASTEPIAIPDLQAHCRLTVRFVGVFLYQAQLNSQFAVSIPGQTLRNAGASISAVFSMNLATGGGRFGGNCAISVQHSLSCTVTKITGYQSAVTSTATVFARGGYEKELVADLSSTATLVCDFDSVPPIRGEAAVTAQFTVTANATSFTDAIIMVMSAGTVSCNVTVIPPIRATANLTSTATLTAVIGTIEQFAVLVMSAGTLTTQATRTRTVTAALICQATVSVTTRRIRNAQASLTAFNTVLTVGEVINLDPYLTYVIPAETRLWQITAESRIIAIEQETRVNIV